MTTLILRLEAPMQSYGVKSKFDRRMTQKEPTKSAVIGMIAAALGWPRNKDIQVLNDAFRFGTRVDQPGRIIQDFHMVHGESAYVTRRNYISDAKFLVCLEGEAENIKKAQNALNNPHYPLFLGRRSCPPQKPLVIKSVEEDLESVIESFPLLTDSASNATNYLEAFVETNSNEPSDYYQEDGAISFSSRYRKYGKRGVTRRVIPIEHLTSKGNGGDEMLKNEHCNHNPFGVLGGK